MNAPALIFMYHKIGIPKGSGLQRNLYVTPRMFRLQMCYLKLAGFRVVSMDDMVRLTRGEDIGSKPVALTFDDGFRNFYENALPVLQEFRYPATVYAVSDLIGRDDTWETCGDGTREPLMTEPQLRECRNYGIEIGSHTKSHPRLTGLSPERLHDELQGSRQALEERLGVPVRHFCYPYGDCNAAVVSAAADAGYVSGTTTQRGRVHVGDNPLELRRSFIRHATNPFLFLLRLHTEYEDRKAHRA